MRFTLMRTLFASSMSKLPCRKGKLLFPYRVITLLDVDAMSGGKGDLFPSPFEETLPLAVDAIGKTTKHVDIWIARQEYCRDLFLMAGPECSALCKRPVNQSDVVQHGTHLSGARAKRLRIVAEHAHG